MTYPMIEMRLSVERMRHEIVQAIGVHSKDLEAAIEATVRDAVARFDWQTEVRKIAEQELRRITNQAITSAIYKAMESPEVRSALASIAAEQLREMSAF